MIDSLRVIKKLKEDLSAEVITQAEEGHYIIVPGSDFGSGPCSFDKDWDEEYIVDREAWRDPDYPTRRAAEARLKKIRDSPDEWPAIRYAASGALGENPKNKPCYDILMRMGDWIEKNEDNLGALAFATAFVGATMGLVYAAHRFFH